MFKLQNKLKRLLKRSLGGNPEMAKLTQILEQYSFFRNIKQKITNEKYAELINEISLVEIPKYQKVFSYGDMGRKFYIILQGSVFIVTPDNVQFSFEEEEKPIDYTFLENQEDKEQYELMCLQQRNMKIVSVLKQDNSFGEVALRSNVPRTATVICREACVLIAINVDVYHSIVEEYHSALYEEDISFLQRFPFLQGWEKSHITNLLRYIRRVQCFGNQVIYNVGDPVEKIYLIKHGEFETDRASFRADDSSDNFDEVDELNLTKKRHVKKEQLCRSAILSDYCSFGIEEVGAKQFKRKNKVVCVSSEALLYVIDKNQYFNVMQDRGLIKDLAVENKTKQVWRDKHGEERKVLNDFYSPKSSQQNMNSQYYFNDYMEQFKLNDNNESSIPKAKAQKRLSLQLTNKRSAQQFQQQLQQNQQAEYHNFSQPSITHQQQEDNQIPQTNSIRKIPLWLNNQKQQQQFSSTKLPQVSSLTETNGHSVNFSQPVSSNLSQTKLSYKGQSSILLSSQTKIDQGSPINNLQSSRSQTTFKQKPSQVDAQLNERPLLDCYVNAMMKKTMLNSHSKQVKQKVFTQKEFFAAIRQTQEKKRYCTPNEEGKNYIYSLHNKQKENVTNQQKNLGNKDMPGSILGELLQDQKVKQDLHNIKQTFLHEQRMSLKNTQLHRKLTANYNL